MGNQACCRNDLTEDRAMENLEDKVNSKSHVDDPQGGVDDINVPELPQRAQKRIEKENFFSEQFSNQTNPHKKQYDHDVYVGDLDESQRRPHGLGKLYKPNGGIYIGHFHEGKAQGRGVFVFNDGSYYQGEFFDNCAEDLKGHYRSEFLSYVGGFKNNTFHGEGQEDGKGYKFIGSYENGVRAQGILTWEVEGQSYKYNGQFNSNNEFHGKGSLQQPKGQYEGDFVNGEKHGQGSYYLKSGFKYEGTYANGYRDGLGTIYNPDNTIFYKGEMEKDLPHGHGVTFANGEETKSTWVEGIDFKELPGQ